MPFDPGQRAFVLAHHGSLRASRARPALTPRQIGQTHSHGAPSVMTSEAGKKYYTTAQPGLAAARIKPKSSRPAAPANWLAMGGGSSGQPIRPLSISTRN